MHNDFKSPPKSKKDLTTFDVIIKRLNSLIGLDFAFAPNKARTNGTNLRKLIASKLHESKLAAVAEAETFQIIPNKGKGVPKIKREFLDTYIVSSGPIYNLQVWNRIPNSESILIEYKGNDHLRSKDVRFILVKVDPSLCKIEAIVGMTAGYIEDRFGKFGKETVKHQLIISSQARKKVIDSPDSILFYDDLKKIKSSPMIDLSHCSIHDEPSESNLFSLEKIKKIIKPLIGTKIEVGPTKNRGQALELIIAKSLGYNTQEKQILVGGYPDIRHQALEVKIQDSATVDLGEFTPEFETTVPNCLGFKTSEIRYLIVLTNPDNNKIEGIILCPGKQLELHFNHVAA